MTFIFSGKFLVTVWERKIKQRDESFRWEHNHLSDGYSGSALPKPRSREQKEAWANAQWKSRPAYKKGNTIISMMGFTL